MRYCINCLAATAHDLQTLRQFQVVAYTLLCMLICMFNILESNMPREYIKYVGYLMICVIGILGLFHVYEHFLTKKLRTNLTLLRYVLQSFC